MAPITTNNANRIVQELPTSVAAGSHRFFDTEHLKADLKERSVRGGAVTMVGQAVKFVIRMASVVILARLLTPEEFGLVAMVTVVTEFILMFKDMGLSTATVQKAEINHAQVSTLFWVNVCVSLIIVVCLVALAPKPDFTWRTFVSWWCFPVPSEPSEEILRSVQNDRNC